jgi:hypothetical protein
MDALVVSRTEAAHAMINRHTNSGFWTRERDRMLRKHAAAGESPEAIATYFATTPKAIQRRLYRLSGMVQPFAKDARGLHEVIGKLPKEKRARQDVVLAAMRAEIKKGMWRDRAIYAARQLDVGLSAIGDALGLSRTQIWRILVLQGAPDRELKERANKHRKERKHIGRQAMDALRSAIARGVPRDQAMAEAYKAGLTFRAIGDVYGLTRERVRQIIARH